MPSPIGHSLAGVLVGWTADLLPGDRPGRTVRAATSWYGRAGGGLTLVCAALASMADLDLALPTGAHRAYTHSVGAVILITIIAALVTGWVTRRRTTNAEHAELAEDTNQTISAGSAASALIVVRIALICGAAYASHVLLDWMAADDTFPYGIRALWPFSSAWYISGWNLFPGTARRHLLSGASVLQNARAIAQEIAILVPIAWMMWRARARALAQLSSKAAPTGRAAE